MSNGTRIALCILIGIFALIGITIVSCNCTMMALIAS